MEKTLIFPFIPHWREERESPCLSVLPWSGVQGFLLGLHVSLAGLCYRTCWVRLRVPAHSIRCINTSWWPTGWKTTWQESTWMSWWTPSWQWTRNVSLWQRQPTSWASLGRALPETPHQMVQCWAPHHTGASPVKGHKIPLRDLRATLLWGKA